MSTPRIYFLVFAMIGCLMAGCHSPRNKARAQAKKDAIHYTYTNGTPVWIFIPNSVWESQGRKGYPAQIALPWHKRYNTNRIEVQVSGEVICRGPVHLPPGSTVLQAINAAGGFTEYSYPKKTALDRKLGRSRELRLRWRPLPGTHHRLVWYSPAEDATPAYDYVLEDGDQIHVPRAVL
jgi:hypothetical protein